MALFILSHPHRTRVTPSWYGPDACPVPPFPPGPGSNRSTLGCPSTAPIHRDVTASLADTRIGELRTCQRPR